MSFPEAARLKHLSRLTKILSNQEVSFDPAVLEQHARDKWSAAGKPEAVVFPKNTQSVSDLLRFANRHRIPVTPRGAGYGYVGGCVPVRGGIALSTERMKKILEINPTDFIA